MLANLTSVDFARYLGEPFTLYVGPRDPATPRITVILTSVTNLGHDDGDYSSTRRPFSLIFSDPEGRYLPQQIYPIEHPAMGALDLFLVPVGLDTGGMQLEAIFS